MKLSLSVRWKIAFYLILFSALAPALRLLVSETAKYYKLNSANKITIYEEKLSKLKDTLPPTVTVGYITNKHDEEFYLTQYALAPRYIVKNIDLPLVIGNFQNPPGKKELRQHLPLILAKDFENGLILFKKGPLK